MGFEFHLVLTEQGNIRNAESILVRNVTQALENAGRFLQAGVRSRVKTHRGAERRNIKFTISGRKLNKLVVVYGDLVQTYVDEFGLPPGIFPPWDVGSLVYNYVESKGLVRNTQRSQHHNFRVRRRPRKVSHVSTRRPRHIRRALARAGHPEAGSSDARGSDVAEARHLSRRARRKAREGSTRSRRAVSRERATRRIAFLVARAIFERGIRAGQPFANTLEASRNDVIHILEEAFVQAVNEINAWAA